MAVSRSSPFPAVPRRAGDTSRRACLAVGLLGLSSMAGAAGPSPDPVLPLLTRIRAIRALSSEDADRHYPVRIRGVVTYVDEETPSGMIVHDGEAGQFVLYSSDYYLRSHRPLGLRRGDLVEIEGRTSRGGFAPNVEPTAIRPVGTASLPTPRHLPYPSLLTGRYDCEYVEVEGIGQRAWFSDSPDRTLFLEVLVDGGIVRASLWGAGPEHADRFVDARVRMRGNVGALFGQAGQLRGVSLLVGRPGDVSVEEAPPDPFTLPERPLSSLYQYSSGGEVGRRIRVRGTVTGQWLGAPVVISDFTANTSYHDVRHLVYIRDETGAALVETVQDTRVQPGDLVEMAGFPTVTPSKPTLQNAVYRVMGTGPPPEPAALPGEVPVAPERDAELVQTEAQLLGVVAGPTQRRLVLQTGTTPFEAVVDASPAAASVEELRPGSRVRVTGIYAYGSGPPPSFRLLLRSPADVQLVSAAPWWTARHSAVVFAIVALSGSAIAVWLRMIANRNRLVREQYLAILAERSRLARELHDTLEQGLAGIKLQLEAVNGSLGPAPPEAARRSLDVAREMLRYSMEEARRSVLDLRPQSLENTDIAGALADLAQRMTAGTALKAGVRVVGEPRPLDASQEHHLFRIGVEALTNAIKHSGAARIDVELRFGNGGVQLIVSDDGRGFRQAGAEPPAEHFGLRGIRERVDKLAGTLDLGGRPEGGARLAVSLPLRGRSHSAAEIG